MTTELELVLRAIWIGAGATALMDIWLVLRHRLFGIPPLNYGFLGRLIGHCFHGQFQHDGMAHAPAIPGERAIGWSAHYAIGIGFAALLLALYGLDWARRPTLIPALIVGVATVIAPLFILQPAMGLGIAGSKTPHPMRGRLNSLLTHGIYGIGLYLSALLCAKIFA